VDKLNKVHLRMTGDGNFRNKNDTKEIYEHRSTANYINVRCKVSKKCRFMVWYKFEGSSEKPTKI